VVLSRTPPIGTPVTLTVEIVGVPGEKTKDNNKQTFTAFFVRG
jgi:hypothetical protein